MNDPVIHAQISKIVEAIKDEYGKMFDPKEGVNWHPLLEQIITTALTSLGGDGDIDINQMLKDEREQAIKRGGEIYAVHYMEGIIDGIRYRHPSEREVLVNYADWFEDNKHNLVGETIGNVIDRYLAEKGKTK